MKKTTVSADILFLPLKKMMYPEKITTIAKAKTFLIQMCIPGGPCTPGGPGRPGRDGPGGPGGPISVADNSVS